MRTLFNLSEAERRTERIPLSFSLSLSLARAPGAVERVCKCSCKCVSVVLCRRCAGVRRCRRRRNRCRRRQRKASLASCFLSLSSLFPSSRIHSLSLTGVGVYVRRTFSGAIWDAGGDRKCLQEKGKEHAISVGSKKRGEGESGRGRGRAGVARRSLSV